MTVYHRPSSASRWLACPASLRLHREAEERDLVDDYTGPYAERGSFAAKLLELVLKQDLSLEEAERAAGEPPQGWGAKDRAAVAEAVDYMQRLRANSDEWGVEHPVEVLPQIGCYGTCDFFAVTRNVLHVVDYKHGRGIPVHAKENPQLMLYALGLLTTRREIEFALLTIIQPRAQKSAVESVMLTREQITEFGANVIETVLFDKSPPAVGEHCRFCPAALVCPARLEEYERVAAMKEDDLNDVQKLVEILRAEKRVTDLIERAKRVALRRLQVGAEIESLALVEGPGRLAWKPGAIEALRASYGDQAFEVTALSPARVRDELTGGDAFVEAWAERRPGYQTVRWLTEEKHCG